MVVLVTLSLPIPYLIIRAGLRELLLGAPDAGFQHQLRRYLGPVFADRGYKACGLRVAKTGRMVYVSAVLSHKATTIAIASTVRKANAKSSFRCAGLLILICYLLRKAYY